MDADKKAPLSPQWSRHQQTSTFIQLYPQPQPKTHMKFVVATVRPDAVSATMETDGFALGAAAEPHVWQGWRLDPAPPA